MFEDVYTQLGLSPEEAHIYQSLLEKGPQNASSLAKNTPVQRTYIYALTQNMIKKGLLSQRKEGKSIEFLVQTPDKLLELVETRKLEAEQARVALENVLPSLKSLYNLSESRPVVTYYEGVEGIKKVYLDTLVEHQPIQALVETSKVHPDIYDWVTRVYARKRVQANIKVQAIVASGPKTEKYTQLNEQELRETKIISSQEFPFEHEIDIYGDKVAIINHKKDSQLIGIIIDNPLIAKTFRSWFSLTWEILGHQA